MPAWVAPVATVLGCGLILLAIIVGIAITLGRLVRCASDDRDTLA